MIYIMSQKERFWLVSVKVLWRYLKKPRDNKIIDEMYGFFFFSMFLKEYKIVFSA